MTTEKNTAPVREPYDAMGPVDALNPPAARATLADAQHGGRVRLGDQAERAWPFVESPGEFTERLRAAMRQFPLIGAVRHVLIENPPTLSAQPSPGGQDALATARDLLAAEYDKAGERVFADRARKGRYDNDPDVHAIVAALAARQPSQQPDSVALGEATEFCVEKGGRQPVREPFGWLIARPDVSPFFVPASRPDIVECYRTERAAEVGTTVT